jgi:predicted aminopeptidase
MLVLLPGCYLGHLAAGQLRVLRARTPIELALQDPATSSDERGRLELVLEARTFARGLGLEVGEQYTSYAPWPGDRLVTAVVATRPGELEPATFWFPLVGDVPYRSYFSVELAEQEAQRLRDRGLDVCLSPVPAYSTLGWLADPVTGPLLRAPHTDLVATVIHELVHATIYVPSDADFNEGLATFVGEEGALRFFAGRDGAAGTEAAEARARIADERAVAAVLRGLREDVAALYAMEPEGDARARQRAALVEAARDRIAALSLSTIDAQALAGRLRTNDACLALEGTYTADLPQYEAALAAQGGDLRALVEEARRAAAAPDPRAALLER